jgi:hypothetical protein
MGSTQGFAYERDAPRRTKRTKRSLFSTEGVSFCHAAIRGSGVLPAWTLRAVWLVFYGRCAAAKLPSASEVQVAANMGNLYLCGDSNSDYSLSRKLAMSV